MDNFFVGNGGSLQLLGTPSPHCCPASPCGNLSEMIVIMIPMNGRKLIGIQFGIGDQLHPGMVIGIIRNADRDHFGIVIGMLRNPRLGTRASETSANP